MKALIASLAVVAALALAGCTAPAPAPAVTVTAPAPTETSTPTPTKTPEVTVGPVERAPLSTPRSQTGTGQMSDADFVALVRKENPALAGVTSTQILDLAHAVCNAFDKGITKDRVFEMLVNGANGNRELGGAMGFIAGAGVVVYCPEHQSKIE